jgi:peroxiredoxin
MQDESHRTPPRRRKVAAVALALGLLVTVGAVAFINRPWASESAAPGALGMLDASAPEPGALAPNFALTDQNGNRVELADFHGSPVFLNFWADWCTFCKEEMPDMQRIAEQFDGALVVLGVNTGDSVATGERFAERAGVEYPRLYDLDLQVTEGYRVQAMPTSYFIDAEGRVAEFSFGVMTYDQMLSKVEALL